jgi:beta-galactosidase/beta-glucuronidase
VDWEAEVAVNDKTLGTHRGGYDGFSFDITDALTAQGPQELTVAVWDPTEGGQPNGKQGLHPAGIFYTPVTGIWRTVWLEPVPQTYIAGLKLVPDVDGGKVSVTAEVVGGTDVVEVEVLDGGKVVARASGKPGAAVGVSIPQPRLWWPDDPFLYDLRIRITRDGQTITRWAATSGCARSPWGPTTRAARGCF